jgi:pectate lyase
MKKQSKFLQIVLLLSVSGFIMNTMLAVPAFPGAEGGGANSTGGRSGDVYEVTNLNDSGSGSLRYGLENASGPLTIIFKVGGTIQLSSTLSVDNKSDITIAGQTAPGDGITIGGANMTQGLLFFRNADNITVRYVRLRKGGDIAVSQTGDCVSIGKNCSDIIFDHCSISWATDENFTIWADDGESKEITMQWCISSEGQMSHSCGFLAGSNDNAEDMTDISVHHNLFTHNNNRNPLLKVKSGDIINNIAYNWGWWSTGIGGGIDVDIIGNLFEGAIDSGARREVLYKPHNVEQSTGPEGNPTIYFSGNIGPHNDDPDGNAWDLMLEMTGINTWGYPLVNGVATLTDIPSEYQSLIRRSTSQPSIIIDAATDLEYALLKYKGVGASQRLNRYGNWVENRDEVDDRIIDEYLTGTGGLVYEVEFPVLTGATAYTDSDHDGMPDAWENLYGLNSSSSSDRNSDYNGNGYTNLEEFLNGTDPIRMFHFNLNETSGTSAYDSFGDFLATLHGGMTFDNDSVSGIAGTALEFDGSNDYATLSPCPSYNGDFSLLAWIKFANKPASGGFGIITVSPSSGNVRMRFAIGTDGKLRYGLYSGSWTEKTGIGDDLSDGEWHHVAVTFDRDGYAKAYVDGVLEDDTLYIASKTGTVSGTHYVGYDSYLTTKYFNGSMDEMKEYSTVLTQTQIARLAKDIPVNFSFNETFGTSAYDSFGNFLATLHGGMTFDNDSVSGIAGTALEFDGSNDYATLSPCPSYDGDFSLSTWIKFSKKPSSEGFGIITVSPSSGNVRMRFAIGTDGKLRYGLYSGSWTEKTGIGDDLSDGEWHHVAVTFDRDGYAKAYVDGVLEDDTLYIASKTGTVSGTHYVGYDSYLTTKYFNGSMDDLREYNRVLTADEIACMTQ